MALTRRNAVLLSVAAAVLAAVLFLYALSQTTLSFLVPSPEGIIRRTAIFRPALVASIVNGVALVASTLVVLAVVLSQAPGARLADVLVRASTSWMLAAGAVSIVPIVAMSAALIAVTARPLPWVQTVLVQLATSFTNALTPAGAGGAALNARYLHCRGLPLAEAREILKSAPGTKIRFQVKSGEAAREVAVVLREMV